MVLFIIFCQVALTFEFVDEILMCDHSRQIFPIRYSLIVDCKM